MAGLRDAAPALPHPALEQAALEHAAFLEDLAGDRDVLTRQALLVVREPGHGAGRPGGTAAGRALQRAGEAARLLAGADLQVQVLDGGQVTALLAACADPAAPPLPAGRLALPGQPVTARGQARMSPRRTAAHAAPGALAAPDMPAPASVEVAARHVRTGDDWSATLAVTGYPAEVTAGWLEPLLSYPGRSTSRLHIEPIPVAVAAARLRRQRARLESGRRASVDRGQLDDPGTESAADDARDLAYRLARGEGKLFRLGLYLTVHAGSEEELAAETAAVRALAASLLLVTVPATFRSLQGWATTLPAGTDQLLLRRTMDTAALAASLPVHRPRTCPATPPTRTRCPACCTGSTPPGRGWWPGTGGRSRNHNSVTLAASGAGKSYLAKLEILRSLYEGTECWVIDPEDEYARLADAVGGAYVHLGAPGVHLNPFDLPAAGRARPDTLTRRALFLHTVIAVLCGGEPSAAERAALDKAIMTAYQRAGITADPRTWARPRRCCPPWPPRCAPRRPRRDRAGRPARPVHRGHPLRPVLRSRPPPAPRGTWSSSALRDVPDELRPAATLLALDTTWRAVSDPARRRRRLITVDEAWLLMRDPEGAKFLFRLAKSARKAWAGLAAVTQDAEDVLSTDLGRAVIANSATQILLRQAPQAIGKVAEEFRLSAGERQLLLSARRGEGLLAAGPSSRVSFQALASPAEHFLCTSDPAEIARMQASQPAAAGPAWPGPDGAAEEDQEDMLP